jgi:hypothetical protein
VSTVPTGPAAPPDAASSQPEARHTPVAEAFVGRHGPALRWPAGQLSWMPDEPTAHLLAAAPDLLAACERMVRDQDRPVFSTDFRGAVDALRAAIAKAKGGAA